MIRSDLMRIQEHRSLISKSNMVLGTFLNPISRILNFNGSYIKWAIENIFWAQYNEWATIMVTKKIFSGH